MDKDGKVEEDTVSVGVAPGVTVERVRIELAKHRKTKPDCIKLVFEKRVLYSSHMRKLEMKDLGCVDGSKIYCYTLPQPEKEPPFERSLRKVILPHAARIELTSND